MTIKVIIIEVLLPRREKGFKEVLSDAIQEKSSQGKCKSIFLLEMC